MDRQTDHRTIFLLVLLFQEATNQVCQNKCFPYLPVVRWLPHYRHVQWMQVCPCGACMQKWMFLKGEGTPLQHASGTYQRTKEPHTLCPSATHDVDGIHTSEGEYHERPPRAREHQTAVRTPSLRLWGSTTFTQQMNNPSRGGLVPQ